MEEKNGKDFNKETKLSLFSENSLMSFIHRKAEKISCAIYLLTSYLPENEPLKWEIRGLCLELLKDIFFLKNYFADNILIIESLKQKVLEIISLTDLLMAVGFISEMNYNILRAEIVNLANRIGSKSNLVDFSEAIFDKDFFQISEPMSPLEKRMPNIFPDSEFNKDLERLYSNDKKDISSGHKGQDKGHISKGHMTFRNMSFKNSSIKESDEINKNIGSERKQKIIAFVKDNKKVTIKDITYLIKDCSEKTIQRDLTALVRAGVLKKEGERRWSKYLLA